MQSRPLLVLSLLLALQPLGASTSRAQQAEGTAAAVPSGWEEADWSLVHRGIDFGPLRVHMASQIFTTRVLSTAWATFGNRSETSQEVALERFVVEGGRMSGPREVALRVEEVHVSSLLSGAVPALRQDGGVLCLTIPPGALLSVRFELPHDLDPALGEAVRGTCYQATLTASVEGTPVVTSGELCWGERIPLR